MFIGIDPGVSGGIAVLADSGRVKLVTAMPPMDADVFDILQAYRSAGAMLERVIPFSAPGRVIGVKSAFTQGKGYGRLLMALEALGIWFDVVMPIKWQNAMQCRTGGDKNVTKRRALELFPTVKVTHAIADALLIAEYGRRLHLGRHDAPSLTRGGPARVSRSTSKG